MVGRGYYQVNGFTIVELLIVIVVIAVLASVSVVAYNGIQKRALESKISSDLRTITQAVEAARINTGKTLAGVTQNTGTAYDCIVKADNTDLSKVSKTDLCWVRYSEATTAIAAASGMKIENMVDPWGRPYYIDQNEGVDGNCDKDTIAAYTYPFREGWYMYPTTPANNVRLSGNSGCAI